MTVTLESAPDNPESLLITFKKGKGRTSPKRNTRKRVASCSTAPTMSSSCLELLRSSSMFPSSWCVMWYLYKKKKSEPRDRKERSYGDGGRY
jgi:hypothetical protein